MPLRDYIQKGILSGEPATCEGGSCLFRQGEKTDYLYLVTKGSVALVGTDRPVNEKVAAPPDFLLGITDLLNDTYSFSAYAVEGTELIRLHKKELQQAIMRNPLLRIFLLKQMSWEATLTNEAFE